MKKNLLLILSLFICTLFSTVIFAQAPANDECTGATVITTVPFGPSCSSSVIATTLSATQSSPDPSCTSTDNNDDIWYKFTAASSSVIIRFGNITNNTTGGGAIAGYALCVHHAHPALQIYFVITWDQQVRDIRFLTD